MSKLDIMLEIANYSMIHLTDFKILGYLVSHIIRYKTNILNLLINKGLAPAPESDKARYMARVCCEHITTNGLHLITQRIHE